MKHENWNGFKNGAWQDEINVRDFIQNNYKEYIGDDIEPVTPEKIVEVNQLMYAAVLIGMLVLCAIKFGILRLILF